MFKFSILCFVLFLCGCTKFVSRQEMNRTVLDSANRSFERSVLSSKNISLAVYECILTQDYALLSDALCIRNEEETRCNIMRIWNNYCLTTAYVNGNRDLTIPRLGVISAIRNTICENHNTDSNDREDCEMLDEQYEINRFVRTPE